MIGALVAGITGSGGASLSSYESIATATGTGSSTTINFNSIPSGFKHLQIRGIVQEVGTGTTGVLRVRFNSDTGSNYAYHTLSGDGATATASGNATVTFMNVANTSRNSSYADTLGSFVIDILDYGSTSKYKTLRSTYGVDLNGSGISGIQSGLWQSTSAITSIDLYAASLNLSTKSTIALYGIKEA